MPIKEVDALANFKLTLDHYYSLVKANIGNLQVNQFVQLQATAIPFDVSEDYEWFSRGNIANFFNVRLEPTPVAENVALLANAKFSNEYILMVSDLLALVEVRQLDSDTLKKIDQLQTAVNNRGEANTILRQKRFDDWVAYAQSSMIDRGDLAIFAHWSQGQAITRQINDNEVEQAREQALISALRIRKYEDPQDQAVVDAYERATGAASRMRFPRFEDKEYGDEQKKFSPVYFAMLPDNESSLFANRQFITPGTSLKTITSGTLGALSSGIKKESKASSSITTDWSANVSASYGPFSMNANASSHEQIKEDFSHTELITVSSRSLMAIPIDATSWFDPDIFRNRLVKKHRRLFERYLGIKGTLLYYPTHLIIVRGLSLKFTSSQEWKYDYEHDFSAGGSASAKIFGVGFGGGAKYSKNIKEQKVEKRGHDLTLDDGENIRILGYVGVKNSSFDDDFIAEFGQGQDPRLIKEG